MEYDPYFALCPGLSDLPSPPRIKPCCFSASLLRSNIWFFSQIMWMVGCRNFFWCLKKVILLIVAQLRVLNILSALAGREPVYNIAADVRRFPAGMLLMYGWLSQTKVLLHWLHIYLMLRNDPMTCRLMETKVLPQATQVANSNMRADSNTRKVNCFSTGICSSSSDVVVSR